MATGEPENVNAKKIIQAERLSRPRGGVSLLAAFLLHQSIYSVVALIALIGLEWGGSSIFQNALSSLLWLVAWTVGTSFFWKRKKPQLTEWVLPFTLWPVYWFLAMPFWQVFDVGAAMFLISCTVLGLALLVRKTHFVLGDGHQQKEQIKRWISQVIPAFGRYHDAPPDILGRISSPPEPSPELLWQPTLPPSEANSHPLLPNGMPGGDV